MAVRLKIPDLEDGPLQDLIASLHEQHLAAGLPSMRVLARGSGYGHGSIHNLFTKQHRTAPNSRLLLVVVAKLAALDRRVKEIDPVINRFNDMWHAAARQPFSAGDTPDVDAEKRQVMGEDFDPVGGIDPKWLDNQNEDQIQALVRVRRRISNMDEELIIRRLREIPKLAKIVYVRRDGEYEFEGYSIVYPLSSNAIDEILTGEVRGGGQIRDRQIGGDWWRSGAFYIASVVGLSREAKLAALHSLHLMVDQSQAEWVFARPATQDSLKLMGRAGFAPLYDERDIWALRVSSSAAE